MANIGSTLHIVEIKAAEHDFDDADFERLYNYVDGFEEFFSNNVLIARGFPNGWKIDLVADGENLSDSKNKRIFEQLKTQKKIERISWFDFLDRAKTAHEKFLNIRDEAKKRRKS